MRFSPEDIRMQSFERRFRGLDEEQVREFLTVLALEWESMIGELHHLQDELVEKDEDLREYKRREHSLLDALELARQVAEQTRQSAEHDAKLVIAEAEQQAEDIVAEAGERAQLLREDCEGLRSQRNQLDAELRQVLARHANLLQTFGPPDAPEPVVTPEASVRRRPGATHQLARPVADEQDIDKAQDSFEEIEDADLIAAQTDHGEGDGSQGETLAGLVTSEVDR